MLKAINMCEQKETEQDSLTRKQAAAIAFVLSSRSISEGLKLAKVSRGRWYEWLKDPGFKAVYEQRRASLLDDAIHALRTSLTKAVDALDDLLDRRHESPATRLRAATSIIEIVTNSDINSEIIKRIEVLEMASTTSDPSRSPNK